MKSLNDWFLNPANTLPAMLLGTLFAQVLKLKYVILLLVDGQLPGNDDYVRLQQVRNWIDGAGWFDVEQAQLGANGIAMHWSRVIDPFIAGFIRIFEPILGTAPAEHLAALFWPMLLFALSVWISIRIVRNLGITLHPLVIGLICGLNGSAMMQFEPGRLDHHNVQILLMMLAILGGTDHNLRRGGLTAGLACAASLMVGMESLAVIAILGLVFACRWSFGDDQHGQRFGAFGAAFAVGIVLAYGVNNPPDRYVSAACDQLSLAYGLPGVLAGLATFTAVAIGLNGIGARLGACLAIAALSFGAITFVAPECLQGPYASLSEEAATKWLPTISEARGLTEVITTDPSLSFVFLFVPLMAIVSGLLLLCAIEKNARWNVAMLWLPALLAFCLSFIQLRQGQFTSVLASPLVAGTIPLVQKWLKSTTWLQGARAQVIVSALLFALSGSAVAAFLFGGTGAVNSAELPLKPAGDAQVFSAANKIDCRNSSTIARVAALPPGKVLNSDNLAGRLLTETPHQILIGPYHRDDRAVLDSVTLLNGSDSEVRQMADDRGADYLVLCMAGQQPAPVKPEGAETFLAHVVRNGAQEWLEEIFIDNGLAVYKVK